MNIVRLLSVVDNSVRWISDRYVECIVGDVSEMSDGKFWKI